MSRDRFSEFSPSHSVKYKDLTKSGACVFFHAINGRRWRRAMFSCVRKRKIVYDCARLARRPNLSSHAASIYWGFTFTRWGQVTFIIHIGTDKTNQMRRVAAAGKMDRGKSELICSVRFCLYRGRLISSSGFIWIIMSGDLGIVVKSWRVMFNQGWIMLVHSHE